MKPLTLNEKESKNIIAFVERESYIEEETKCKQDEPNSLPKIRPSRKRFFVLLMFVILSASKSFQWVCLASITKVVARFYNVSNLAINSVAIIFMVTFLILALPITWVMERIGLRNSVLIGSIGVAIGVLVKCFSCTPNGFIIGMIGNLIIGLVEPFFYSSFSQFSSVWFPDHQVAMATSIGIIGEEIGIAIGFILPNLLVGNKPDNVEHIQQGLFLMFSVLGVITVLNAISIYFFFDEQPIYAPGIARLKQIEEKKLSNETQEKLLPFLWKQAKLTSTFLHDKNFNLLLISFGLSAGIAYSIHTLLAQMILNPKLIIQSDTKLQHELVAIASFHHQDGHHLVGNLGFILIIAGLFGSIICGHLLDTYHRYRLTSAIINVLGLISMILFTLSLLQHDPKLLYASIVPLGLSLTGYWCCAFEYGVELTYPKPELISATVLNVVAQIFGIPISIFGSIIVDNYGNQALGLFLSIILIIGCIISCIQDGELLRQKAVNLGVCDDENDSMKASSKNHSALSAVSI